MLVCVSLVQVSMNYFINKQDLDVFFLPLTLLSALRSCFFPGISLISSKFDNDLWTTTHYWLWLVSFNGQLVFIIRHWKISFALVIWFVAFVGVYFAYNPLFPVYLIAWWMLIYRWLSYCADWFRPQSVTCVNAGFLKIIVFLSRDSGHWRWY